MTTTKTTKTLDLQGLCAGRLKDKIPLSPERDENPRSQRKIDAMQAFFKRLEQELLSLNRIIEDLKYRIVES